jgi:hypothetical protein
MGTKSFISLSGTAAATVNGDPFETNNSLGDPSEASRIYIDAQERRDGYGDWLGSSNVADDGTWRIILPSVTGPRTIELSISLSENDQTSYHRSNIWTGPVNNTPVSTGPLNAVFKIISGTVGTITLDGGTPDYVVLAAVNGLDYTYLGDVNVENNGSWTIDVGNYTGVVRFMAGAYNDSDGFLIMNRSLLGPQITVGTGGFTGVPIGNVSITTHDISVTVYNGASPISRFAVAVTSAPITYNELMGTLPTDKIVTLPQGEIQFLPGPRNIPVADGQPTSLYFLAAGEDGRIYITDTPLNTSSGSVVLDITSGMHYLGDLNQ